MSVETMKKFLSFACASCIFGTIIVQAQTAAKMPSADPFRIDQGSSFSASTSPRPGSVANASTATPAAGRIISDVSQALELIRNNHVNAAKLDAGELMKSSVSSMLAELDPHS
ncbi:MAG: hypothetical protein ABI646_07250, partial [Acidobacteriota bacterium]